MHSDISWSIHVKKCWLQPNKLISQRTNACDKKYEKPCPGGPAWSRAGVQAPEYFPERMTCEVRKNPPQKAREQCSRQREQHLQKLLVLQNRKRDQGEM